MAPFLGFNQCTGQHLWIQACYARWFDSGPSFQIPGGTLSPTKLGFRSIQTYFLSLISWVLYLILVYHYSVTTETLLLQCSRGGETLDLVCPDAEHAAAARRASCKAATSIWAEKEDSSGAAGLLLGDRSLLSQLCPTCRLMVPNSAVQYCKLLSAPLALSDPQ